MTTIPSTDNNNIRPNSLSIVSQQHQQVKERINSNKWNLSSPSSPLHDHLRNIDSPTRFENGSDIEIDSPSPIDEPSNPETSGGSTVSSVNIEIDDNPSPSSSSSSSPAHEQEENNCSTTHANLPTIDLSSNDNNSTLSTVSRAPEVPSDKASHVSLLGGRYLLFAQPGSSSGSLNRNYQRCVHVDTREQFTCKVIPRDVNGLSVLAAYHRLDENCKCINPLKEVVLAPRFIYLILPINFGNVHSYILMKKRLKEAEAVNIFRQMVEIVQYCHEKGIVLRDLKMGKFIFQDKERTLVKLESLEDAVLLTDIEDDGLSDKHGCPNYVSPEKAEILRSNRKYPGRATDIWGLGIILFTMLVGRYPFNDSDHSKLFAKIRKGHFTIPETLSTSAKCLIRCLLRKSSSERLSCSEILKHPWLSKNDPSHHSRINFQFCGRGGNDATRRSISVSTSSTHITNSFVAQVVRTQNPNGFPNVSINLQSLAKHTEQKNDDQVVPDISF